MADRRYVVVSYDGLGEFWGMLGDEPEFRTFGWPYSSYAEAMFARDDLLHMSFYCYVKGVTFQEDPVCSSNR